jgi:hypothetical protein
LPQLFTELAFAFHEPRQQIFNLREAFVWILDDQHVGGHALDALLDGFETSSQDRAQ